MDNRTQFNLGVGLFAVAAWWQWYNDPPEVKRAVRPWIRAFLAVPIVWGLTFLITFITVLGGGSVEEGGDGYSPAPGSDYEAQAGIMVYGSGVAILVFFLVFAVWQMERKAAYKRLNSGVVVAPSSGLRQLFPAAYPPQQPPVQATYERPVVYAPQPVRAKYGPQQQIESWWYNEC